MLPTRWSDGVATGSVVARALGDTMMATPPLPLQVLVLLGTSSLSAPALARSTSCDEHCVCDGVDLSVRR